MRFPQLNYGQKLTLIATIPLVLAAAAIAVLVVLQSRAMAEREIQVLETQLLEAKKAELRNYVHAGAQRLLLHLRKRRPG